MDAETWHPARGMGTIGRMQTYPTTSNTALDRDCQATQQDCVAGDAPLECATWHRGHPEDFARGTYEGEHRPL